MLQEVLKLQGYEFLVTIHIYLFFVRILAKKLKKQKNFRQVESLLYIITSVRVIIM